MTPVTYSRPVHYYETDRMDCVHHSNYIRWFEEARTYLMQVMDFPYEGMEAEGILSPVLGVQAQYKTMARYGDTVDVETRLVEFTGTRGAFSYTVKDHATGAVRCVGRTEHCFLKEGRPVSLKKALPEYFEKMTAAVKED